MSEHYRPISTTSPVSDSVYSAWAIGLITDGGDGNGPRGVTVFRDARVWRL